MPDKPTLVDEYVANNGIMQFDTVLRPKLRALVLGEAVPEHRTELAENVEGWLDAIRTLEQHTTEEKPCEPSSPS